MLKVAAILENKTVHADVSLVIAPGSKQVFTMLAEIWAEVYALIVRFHWIRVGNGDFRLEDCGNVVFIEQIAVKVRGGI